MKRGEPPKRKTQLRRTEMRRNPSTLARSALGTRRTRIKPMSDRTRAEIPQRQEVRGRALAAAGYRCSMADKVPEIECGGPLDVDEIKSRGVNPGGHLDDDNVQVACRLHHIWRTEHPAEAHARGLRKKSWED